jgi:GNAT superfamily N-acetyltransferase
MTSEVRVRKLTPDSRPDFWRAHCEEEGCGWCWCTAWWVPSWEGWKDRTDAENRTLRESLFARGEDDGYLLYVDGEPAGWCQVGARDRLPQLTTLYGLSPDPDVQAITCFAIRPPYRGKGLWPRLLDGVLEDLRSRGAPRVQAFPRAGAAYGGTDSLYLRAGFVEVARAPRGPVYERTLRVIAR